MPFFKKEGLSLVLWSISEQCWKRSTMCWGVRKFGRNLALHSLSPSSLVTMRCTEVWESPVCLMIAAKVMDLSRLIIPLTAWTFAADVPVPSLGALCMSTKLVHLSLKALYHCLVVLLCSVACPNTVSKAALHCVWVQPSLKQKNTLTRCCNFTSISSTLFMATMAGKDVILEVFDTSILHRVLTQSKSIAREINWLHNRNRSGSIWHANSTCSAQQKWKSPRKWYGVRNFRDKCPAMATGGFPNDVKSQLNLKFAWCVVCYATRGRYVTVWGLIWKVPFCHLERVEWCVSLLDNARIQDVLCLLCRFLRGSGTVWTGLCCTVVVVVQRRVSCCPCYLLISVLPFWRLLHWPLLDQKGFITFTIVIPQSALIVLSFRCSSFVFLRGEHSLSDIFFAPFSQWTHPASGVSEERKSWTFRGAPSPAHNNAPNGWHRVVCMYWGRFSCNTLRHNVLRATWHFALENLCWIISLLQW